MKLASIVASMFVGLVLGTGIAVASASTPTPAHSTPVLPVEVAPTALEVEHSTEPRVITIPEVTIRANKPARKAKAWTCGDWQDSNVGGRYKACEWK